MTEIYDIVIIGSGPGGYVAALRAASLGRRTALVERGSLGGVCLNVGCIPSKALIQTASLFDRIRHAGDFGINAGAPTIDFAKAMARKDRVVKRLTTGVGYLCRTKGVQVIKGIGRLAGPDSVDVDLPDGSKTSLKAGAIVLATGSEPSTIPNIAIDEGRVLSSTGALGLRELPKSMIVLGGGYIGVELGTAFAKLGTKVTIVELLNQLLPGTEADLVEPVFRRLRKLGVDMLLSARAKGVDIGTDKVILAIEAADGEKKIEAERLLVSVGRRPMTRDVGLDKVGIEPDELGLIRVDGSRRTAVETIYAIGDITSGPQLAHKASHEGMVAVEAISGLGSRFEPASIPTVVFTDPEIACVGLSEQEAAGAGIEVSVGKFPFLASGRALTMDEADGFVKVIAERANGKVAGVRIVGPEASNMISEAALALQLGATAGQIADTIHPHPTLGETIMEAALAAIGKPIHI